MRIESATRTQRRGALAILCASLLSLALGCASTSPQNQTITDSLEPMNRQLFRLGEAIDDYGFGPAARGYKRVTNEPVRAALLRAERNLGFPARFVSLLGQAELVGAGSELGRFVLNSTLGVAGLFDPGTEAGLAKHDADLGQMLAVWHVPPGPFLMLPVFGPSTSRDATMDLVAMLMNPLAWTTSAAPPVGALFAVNRRADADDEIRRAKATSLDYYVFLRDAFIQRRTREIRGDSYDPGLEAMQQPEDLYDLRAEASEANAAR
jgi:phospholipid-binding lipoprotein MlaA